MSLSADSPLLASLSAMLRQVVESTVAPKIDSIITRLDGIEARIASGLSAPVARSVEAPAPSNDSATTDRLDSLYAKLDSTASTLHVESSRVESSLARRMDGLYARLSSLETKVEEGSEARRIQDHISAGAVHALASGSRGADVDVDDDVAGALEARIAAAIERAVAQASDAAATVDVAPSVAASPAASPAVVMQPPPHPGQGQEMYIRRVDGVYAKMAALERKVDEIAAGGVLEGRIADAIEQALLRAGESASVAGAGVPVDGVALEERIAGAIDRALAKAGDMATGPVATRDAPAAVALDTSELERKIVAAMEAALVKASEASAGEPFTAVAPLDSSSLESTIVQAIDKAIARSGADAGKVDTSVLEAKLTSAIERALTRSASDAAAAAVAPLSVDTASFRNSVVDAGGVVTAEGTLKLVDRLDSLETRLEALPGLFKAALHTALDSHAELLSALVKMTVESRLASYDGGEAVTTPTGNNRRRPSVLGGAAPREPGALDGRSRSSSTSSFGFPNVMAMVNGVGAKQSQEPGAEGEGQKKGWWN
ncbi:hypothetical protein HK101_008010 [Irineochytrium annulatum]|nr:hypothetical protein HK101_008010 [Irineochytrium annulatum]